MILAETMPIDDPATLLLKLDGKPYEAEMDWLANFVDMAGLHGLLNRVLADTSAARRFYHPWMGEASGAFLPPDATDEVQSFFRSE